MSFRKITVLDRAGADLAEFQLTAANCLIGRGKNCDIRIKLDGVLETHCIVNIEKTLEANITSLSTESPVTLNLHAVKIDEKVTLKNGDVFSILDRSFRYNSSKCHKESFRKIRQKSKTGVKEKSRRRRKAKKQRYMENLHKSFTGKDCGSFNSVDRSEDQPSTKNSNSSSTYENDPLFTGLLKLRRIQRQATFLNRKYHQGD